MRNFYMTRIALLASCFWISIILLISVITNDYSSMVFPICWILLNGIVFVFFDLFILYINKKEIGFNEKNIKE